MTIAIDMASPAEGAEGEICQLFEVSPQEVGPVLESVRSEQICHLFEIPADSLRTELLEVTRFRLPGQSPSR